MKESRGQRGVNLPKSAMPPELVIDVQMVTGGTKRQVLKMGRDRTGRQERAEDVDMSELHKVFVGRGRASLIVKNGSYRSSW